MSVSIVVGSTVITRTLSSERYARNAWPRDNNAAFVAQYVPTSGRFTFANAVAMFTITPSRCAIIPGATARVSRSMPR